MTPKPRLILASASPRRRDLLRQVGIEFESQSPRDAEDPARPGEAPAAYARRSAEAKAIEVSARQPDALTLGADTVVALDGRALGKPVDEADARSMLRALSGRSHVVHTGVSVAFAGKSLIADVASTDVTFRALTDDEVDAYVGTGEPMDKAGAYGIQARGALLVSSVCGCYFNVVGLPLSRTAEMLAEAATLIKETCGDPKC